MSVLAGSAFGVANGHKVERRTADIIPLSLPGETDRQGVIDWALKTVADAERRLLTLQERIAYLEGLSVTDELTGLLNRRGFMSELERTLSFARRGGPRGALVIWDLDNFKAINDSAGHLVGDEVLCHVARLLSGQVRRSDVVARLGGDEFAILLAGAPREAARRKAQNLAHLIAATPARTSVGEIAVAASFGIGSLTGEEREEDLIKRADVAMYGQKRRHATRRSAIR